MARVIIFDVDHGSCAFVKSPTGCSLMIDCGRKDGFSPVSYVSDHELDGTPVHSGHRLTQLLITHPHDDHIEDIESISSKLPPYILQRQQYYWDEVKAAESHYENLDHYRTWQATYNAPVIARPNWGMDVKVFSLTPHEAYALNSNKWINNSGMVVVITIPGTVYSEKFVFGADLEEDGWNALLQNLEFRRAVAGTDFFIVSHHGHSSGFSPTLFAAMGKPFLNLVSVASGDEHVDPAYSSADYAKGASVGGVQRYSLTTRWDGSIFVDVDAMGRSSVRTYNLVDNELLKAFAAMLR
jgi:beta-lactamase superfamily II metal-dependent hydrolase